jgi:hypothetical protein
MEEKWNSQDVWHRVQPPARPSQSDLKFIEDYLQNLKPQSSKALILGCTPEYRDLLMKYNIDSFCADYQSESFNEFKNLMKYEDKSKLIEIDWRKMKFVEEYDLILGDLSFTMLNLSDWDNVASRIHTALKKGGKSFQRIWLRFPGKYVNFDDLIKEHKTRIGMHPFTSLGYPFLQHFVKEDDSFNAIEVVDHLREKYEQGILTKDEFLFFEMLWKEFKPQLYFPIKENAEEIFSKYFLIEKIKYCDEWFRDFSPIYVLEKKK